MTHYVYILQSRKNGSFYKGSTDNLVRRFADHNSGKNTSTARYLPWDLVWYTKKVNKSEAVILEMKLKNLSVQRIIDFIKKYPVEIENDLEVTPVRIGVQS
ncbi:MAG TPA: GIY-YIG nuclease family protein [Cyclobacteriaceae bacterium]|nr:GIY-YIG nuclease family protein [Cyclobacteriaceae bacterium]